VDNAVRHVAAWPTWKVEGEKNIMMKDLNSVSITGSGRRLPTGRYALALESLKKLESKRDGGGKEMVVIEFKVVKVYDQQPRAANHPAGERAAVNPGEVNSYVFHLSNGDVVIANLRQLLASLKDVDWQDEAALAQVDANAVFRDATGANNPYRGTLFFCDVDWRSQNKVDPKNPQKELWFGKHSFYPRRMVARYEMPEKK
jgi:hypothetical protein